MMRLDIATKGKGVKDYTLISTPFDRLTLWLISVPIAVGAMVAPFIFISPARGYVWQSIVACCAWALFVVILGIRPVLRDSYEAIVLRGPTIETINAFTRKRRTFDLRALEDVVFIRRKGMVTRIASFEDGAQIVVSSLLSDPDADEFFGLLRQQLRLSESLNSASE